MPSESSARRTVPSQRSAGAGGRAALHTVLALAALLAVASCGGVGDGSTDEETAARFRGVPVERAEEPEGAEAPGAPAPRVSDWPRDALRAGGVVTAELAPGAVRAFRLPLAAGTFLELEVEQRGVDVVVSLDDPAGRTLLRVDRRIEEHGPELVLAAVETGGTHTLRLEAFPAHGPGRCRLRIEALRPADAADLRAAATYRAFWETKDSARDDPERAASVWEEALATWRELGEPALEAEVLDRIALGHFDADRWGAAAARWHEAAVIYERLGDRRRELFVRDDLGAAYVWLARNEDAVEQYRRSAELARALGDLRQEASAHYGLGSAYRRLGELQRALGHYEAALEHLPEGDHERATALHSLGSLYRLHFQDPERARELLRAAAALYRPGEVPTDAAYKARALHQLALLARQAGRPGAARGYLEASLALRDDFDRCGRAGSLATLALVEDEAGRAASADRGLAEAREILAGASCPGTEPGVELLAAEIAARRGALDAALAGYRRASERAEAIGDRLRLAEALAGTARTERARGRLPEALAASARGLGVVEEVRPTVLREDLRTAFFATAQDQYDLHIGLLAALGRDAEAWAAAERGRAQALRDLLLEAGAGVRGSADADLAAAESDLRHRIARLEYRRLRARDGAEGRALRREIDARVEELERVRGEIRRGSAAYAAATAPLRIDLERVRDELLAEAPGEGAETLLLEYRLGEEESWLWAIGRDSFHAFRLPPRAEIEPLARQTTGWLRSLRSGGPAPPAVCALARRVLAPAVALLADRRLAVVADGALEAVPFAALPDPRALGDGSAPCPDAPPLGARHEVVHLPSVGALLAQRSRYRDRPPAAGWLAVVADPAYGEPVGSPGGFARLSQARAEAEALVARLPRRRTFQALGAAASKLTVRSGALAGHRIVHFATHGVHDPEQPLLSFLALSERTADGEPLPPAETALHAHEIYDLALAAELVVLSACDTASGREVRGEGLVAGLPRAFLYAGAERVLVSLWPVEDRSTRDLMTRFYRGLLEERLPPGRALQEAQRALRRAGRAPHQWAGFVLQGDWRLLAPFEDGALAARDGRGTEPAVRTHPSRPISD